MKHWLALIALVCATPLRGEVPPKLASTVDRLVQPYLDSDLIHAVSIGVVQGDQQWTKHYGRLSAQNPNPPTDQTIYEIGSISKVFTGILLADAVISKRVALDLTIGELMPTVAEKNPAVAQAIQLKHLSTHLSGLPRMPANMRPADVANPYADYGRQEMIDFLCSVEPKRKPLEASEYSNYAVGLLGEILALQAEKPYADLLDETIVEPLAMDDTRLAVPAGQGDRLAPPHSAGLEPAKNWDFDAFAGAGGICSTVVDMQRFIRANLNPSREQVNGRLRQALELAWQEQSPPVNKSFAMGLGWHIARDGATRWHNGQTGGYHSMLMVDRRIDAGIVVLSNTATGQIDSLTESILRAVAGLPVEPIAIAKPIKVDPGITARLAGDYAITPNFVLTVRADGNKLYVLATGQPEARVFPLSDTKWNYRIVEAQLTFTLPEQGSATKVTLHQNGRDMPASRVERDP